MRRDLLILAAALLALVAAVLVTGATLASGAEALRGYANPAQTEALPAWTPRLGVNADLRLYEGGALARTLDQMRATNMTWVRQPVPWASIEVEPGRFDWTAWDAVFAPFATDPTLRLVPVLLDAPVWAVDPDAPDPASAPPADPAAFARFAAAFAERYGAFVDHYQIWDEPNLEAGWGGLDPQPSAYVALLAAAAEAIHGADPRATVVAAGLAPTTETGPKNLSDVDYLDSLLALGAANYMDAAAGKPFGFDSPPGDRTVSPDVLNFSRIILLREVLTRYGLDTMPLWATGWGWNSLPDDWAGAPSIWGAVTPEQQAAFTLEAIDRAEREWPWLGGMTLHTWQPDTPPTDPQWGFALLDAENRPTLLYDTLAARPGPTAAVNGLYAPANPFASYSGEWRFGELGADIGQAQDSQATLQFEGRDVALSLRQDDYVAYLFVTVDGEPANALPTDASGNAYIILTSDTRQPITGLTTVAANLTDGAHELHVIADRGWDRWSLAGYTVSSGDLAAPWRDQLAVALFTVAAAGIAVVVSVARLDWSAVGQALGGVWNALGAAGQVALSAVAAVALLLGMLLSFGGIIPEALRREPVALGVAAAAAVAFYVSPPLLLALVAGLVLFVIFYHRPDLGLMLVAFFTPFYLFPVELYRFAFPMAELLLLLLAVAWALREAAEWARGQQSASTEFPGAGIRGVLRRATLLDICVGAYLALGALAVVWSQQRGPAVTELRVLFIEPAIFYAILRSQSHQRAVLLGVVDALVAAGVAVAAIGMAQYLRGELVVIAEGGVGRLASVYGSPNNAALFLERALPFALVMAFSRFDARRRWFGALAAAAIAAALVLTLSAGALFLGVPFSLALLLLLLFGRRAFVVLGGMVLLLAGGLLVALQTERFSRLLDFNAGTTFFRVRVWNSALQMIADRPLTGIGLDQFLYAYRGQYMSPDAWQEPDLSHPHNILLDFWLRLGLLGAVLLVVLQIAFWSRAFRVWRTTSRSASVNRALIIGAMGSMMAVVAHGIVDNAVFVNDLALVFMVLLAIAASLPIRPPAEATAP